MSHNYLTIHTLITLPHHARNRDDRNAPKSHLEGGVPRGILSPQSQKREARLRYELGVQEVDRSIRSRNVVDHVLERAESIAEAAGITFDRGAATKDLRPVVKTLTDNTDKAKKEDADKAVRARAAHEKKSPAGLSEEDLAEYMAVFDAKAASKVTDKDEVDSDTVIWVSSEEVETLANLLVKKQTPTLEDAFSKSTGSLAIAAFGRMFAFQPGLSTEAAFASSPAITTHSIVIEFDPFTAVDDLDPQGAAHLNQQAHTSGVYYRSVTIDRRQLQESWTGFNADDARDKLRSLIRHNIESVPQGKKNSAAAEALPAVIVAESQLTRTGYNFERPVTAGVEGGFLEGSVSALLEQVSAARSYDPAFFGLTVFGGTELIGTTNDHGPVVTATDLVDTVVDWIYSK